MYRLEQIVEQTAERDHGTPGVHEKQQFYRIFPGLFHDDLQTAAIVAGLVHRAVYIQFRLGNVQSAGKLPQPAKRKLKLPIIQYSVIPEIPVLAGAHHGKGGLVSGLTSNPYAPHIAAHIAKRGLAHGTDPETSPVVFLVLVFQPLLESLLHLFLVHMDVLHLV